MNPRAAAFTPCSSSPEPSLDGNRLGRSRTVPTGPRSWKQKVRARPPKPDALDPDNYDTMFPTLSTPAVSSPDSSEQRSSKKLRKKKKQNDLVAKGGDPDDTVAASKPNPQSSSSLVSDTRGQTKKETATVEKTTSELPSPVVHASSNAVSKQDEPAKPVLPAPVIKSKDSVHVAPFMPPTPRPDHEFSATRNSDLVAYSTSPVLPVNFAPSQPTPQFYHNVMAPPGLASPVPAPIPGYYYPQQYAHYPAVYVTTPPIVWQSAFTPVPAKGCPEHPGQECQQPGYWEKQLPMQNVHGPPLQFEPGSGSFDTSRRQKGSRPSSRAKRRSTDSRRIHQGGNQGAVLRPASTAGHKTQVEVLKSKCRAKSASPIKSAPGHQVLPDFPNQSMGYGCVFPTMTRQGVAGEQMGLISTNVNEQIFRQHLLQKFEGEEAFKQTSRLETGRTSCGGQVKSVAGEGTPKIGRVDSDILENQLLHNTTPSTHDPTQLPPIGPPVNAPKAPASRRRVPQASLTFPHPPPSGSPAENGAWSQSKRWMSKETKERVAFQKMLINLHYMGADKSPFVPQTPAELTAFKLKAAECEKRKLIREVAKRMAKVDCKILAMQKDKKVESPTALFGGKQLRDKLSPVFAAMNCFNKELPTADNSRVDWPSLAELKEEGDKRASRYGRYFPLPRLNMIAARFASDDRDNAFNPDGSIRWEKKAVKLDIREIMPVAVDLEHKAVEPAVELRQEELPVSLQLILEHINGVQDEGEKRPHEKETGKEDK
ncbi:hypothetical protein AK830_g11330 [Neonectria ditissima]|uniref:Uncharacterized protein n=1 Tax=Neonectria ditissima TaxID=78410 RepID=A0A0P7B8B4_9HYPO|nr:hypothetical protein AK830_g11330 [Neonectria ditissima]